MLKPICCFWTLWGHFAPLWLKTSNIFLLWASSSVEAVLVTGYFCIVSHVALLQQKNKKNKKSRCFFCLACTDWIISVCQFRGLGSVHRPGGDGSCRRHRCHRLWMECEKSKTQTRVFTTDITRCYLWCIYQLWFKCIVPWNEAEQAC